MEMNGKSEKGEDSKETAESIGPLQCARRVVLNLKNVSNNVFLCKAKDPDDLHSVRARFFKCMCWLSVCIVRLSFVFSNP